MSEHQVETDRKKAVTARVATAPVHEAGPTALFESLQRSAGNAAVNRLLRQHTAPRAFAFQHAPTLPPWHTLGSTLARSAVLPQEPALGSEDQVWTALRSQATDGAAAAAPEGVPQAHPADGDLRHGGHAGAPDDRTVGVLPHITGQDLQRLPGEPPAMVQRFLNYPFRHEALDPDPLADRPALVAALRKKFPLLSGQTIENRVAEIEAASSVWNPQAVYGHFAKLSGNTPAPLSSTERNSSIRLPQKPSDRRSFGFTTRTRLGGFIRTAAKKDIPLKEYSQDKNGHAEDNLVADLNNMLAAKQISIADDIVLTINNSPCFDRCSKMLPAWQSKTRWRGAIIIQFANPYGKDAQEYVAARGRLHAAGIEVTSFDPTAYLSSEDQHELTDRQKKDFKNIKQRRKLFRPAWNKQHPDDPSSDSDTGEVVGGKPSATRKTKAKRGTSTARGSGSDSDSSSSAPRESPYKKLKGSGGTAPALPPPENDSDNESMSDAPISSPASRTSPRTKLKGSGRAASRRLPGQLRDVSGHGMNCLIRALLVALGQDPTATRISTLRRHLIQQGVAQQGEMLSLAEEAGAFLISRLVQLGMLDADRGIHVYMPDGQGGFTQHTVIDGASPINLYLSDAHFQAIL